MDRNDKPVERKKVILLQKNLIDLGRSEVGNYIVAQKVLEAAKHNLLQAQSNMTRATQEFSYWKNRLQKRESKKPK
jgi:hypothetical protein